MLMGTGAFAEWVKPKLKDYGINNPQPSGVLVQGDLDFPGAYGYLFNEESGGFFVGANEHGTRASVSEILGHMVFLEDRNDEYYWSIISFVLQGNAKNNWRRTCVDSPKSIWVDNNYGPYVDTWTITQLGNGKFTIGNYGEVFDGMTLGVYTDKAPAGDSRLYLANKATAENFGDTWYFVNEEEYTRYTDRVKEIYDEYYEKSNIYSHAVALGKAINDAEDECADPLIDLADEKAVYNNTESTLEQLQDAIKKVNQKVVAWRNENKYSKATYEDPMDVTSLITNPSFEEGNLSGWTVNTSGDTGAKDSNNATYHCDNTDGCYLFNTWDEHRGYPISQRLENIPNGVYKLGALVTSTTTNAYLFVDGGMMDANGNEINAHRKVVLQDHVDGKAKTEWFTLGERFFAVEDGTVTIGAVGAGADGESYVDGGYSWYKADNFTLTYYGNQAEGYHRVLEDAVSEIYGWYNANEGKLTADKKQKLANALDAIPNDKSGKTVDELIVLLKNLYAVYAEAKEPAHYSINESKLITANATDLDGVEVVVTDPTGEKTWAVFTGNDGQDINANCTSVYDWSSKSDYSKIKFYAVDGQPDNVYYIKFVNADGDWYNPRGNWHGNAGCMNVTGNGTGLFVGGHTNFSNGQDVVNGALWQVTKTADGYTFYNIGKEKYAVPGIGVTSTETSLKLYTEFDLYDPEAVVVNAVVEKINAIGTVEFTDECKALIDAAREAYDALTEDQQALITEDQLKVLTDAEAEYKRLQGIVTGISVTNAADKMKDGKSVKDGKFIIVKDGKEYNAQGQKM